MIAHACWISPTAVSNTPNRQLLLSDAKVSCGWVENLSSDVYMEDENWVRYTAAASGEVVSKCTHHENGLTLI
jgi:hypothetical protein